MNDQCYKVADCIQFVGKTVKIGGPPQGRIGTVVEIAEDGNVIVRFGRERIAVRADDASFKKIDTDS